MVNHSVFEMLQHASTRFKNEDTPISSNLSWTGLIFYMNDKEWIVPLIELNEILALKQMTAIPNVKNWLRGVVNLRGELLTVSDLNCFFYNKTILLSKNNRIIAIHENGEWTGILIEKLGGLVRVSDEKLVPINLKDFLDTLSPYLSKLVMVNNKKIPILHLKKIIQSNEYKSINQSNGDAIG